MSHGNIGPSLHGKQLSSKSFASNHSIAEIQDEHIKLWSRYKVEKDIRSVQRDSIRDPEVENEILAQIEPQFFEFRDVAECEDFVAQKLPETLDLDFIISEKNRLKKQLAIVSRKVTDLMTKNQSAYFGELQRVIALQHIVNDCINTCAKARSSLKVSKNNLTVRGLHIVTDFKRRENLVSLLTQLTAQNDATRRPLTAESNSTDLQDNDTENEGFQTPSSLSPVKDRGSPAQDSLISGPNNLIAVQTPGLDS